VSKYRYGTQEPPTDPKDIPEYLSRELRNIEEALSQLSDENTVAFIDQTAAASVAGIIIADASQTAVVVTLPGAAASRGVAYRIGKSKGANNVVVRSSETINGVSSSTLSLQYQFGVFVCDGTEWYQS